MKSNHTNHQPVLTTYSFWNAFRNCRKACAWRYLEELVPQRKEAALSFGTLIHSCLERYHGGAPLLEIPAFIDESLPNRSSDEGQKQDWHLAHAMMLGYVSYNGDNCPVGWEVVALEQNFEGKIVNPATGASSRSLTIAGKVDGIVKIDGAHYILEHKTASQIDGDYLDKLWTDLQITLYAHYIEKTRRIKIAGVIYNILVKARLQQSKGETQEEFEQRREDLLAKSKTGKTTATRKLPESDVDFACRLAAKYREPGMFHREVLYIGRDQIEETRRDLWELSQQFLDARRRDAFNRNTAHCFAYHRPCSYLPLCQDGGSEITIANFYERRPPHEELLGEGSDAEATAATAQEVF